MDLQELIAAGRVPLDGGGEAEIAVDPGTLRFSVPEGASRSLVVVRTKADAAETEISVGRGAELSIVEICLAEAFVAARVRQEAGSRCRISVVELSGAHAGYTLDLDGSGAENRLQGLFLAAGDEHCELQVRVNHHTSDCRSDSLVKGVAGGRAVGEFRGLVYVAPDAQRTDARQTSRNLLLGREARIVAEPQLEIYADDVKCSHGATVGQLESDAILYMRQRGLSERQARRLQIEGFAGDVVARCGAAALGEALGDLVAAKLERM